MQIRLQRVARETLAQISQSDRHRHPRDRQCPGHVSKDIIGRHRARGLQPVAARWRARTRVGRHDGRRGEHRRRVAVRQPLVGDREHRVRLPVGPARIRHRHGQRRLLNPQEQRAPALAAQIQRSEAHRKDTGLPGRAADDPGRRVHTQPRRQPGRGKAQGRPARGDHVGERRAVRPARGHVSGHDRERGRRIHRVDFPARVGRAQPVVRCVHDARARALHIEPQRAPAGQRVDTHEVIRAVERRHLGDGAGQPGARRQGEVRRVHAADFAGKAHPVNHAAVRHGAFLRALPRHRRHGRHLRIQTDRTGGRQLDHIRVRAAGRGQRRRSRTKIKVHGPAKQAHDIHLPDRVDRQPVPAVVGGSAPALRPHMVAAGSQLQQKRVLAPFRSRRVGRARPRVQIHRTAERSEQVHPARGVQRHRLHVVASGSTQLPTPPVATIRVHAHHKAVAFSARGQRRRARAGVEVRRAAETARHGRISVSAHRKTVAKYTGVSAQALACAHGALRIESYQGRGHAGLRHKPGRTERGIEVRRTRQ